MKIRVLCRLFGEGFMDRLRLQPSASAISRMVGPSEHRTCSLAGSIEMGLRPMRKAFARQFAIPALTRSRMRSRSNSANDATMLNINRPAGVVRSKLSRQADQRDTKCLEFT